MDLTMTEELARLEAATSNRSDAQSELDRAAEIWRDEVRRCHQAGLSVARIAEAGGVSRVTIYQVIKEGE